MGSSPAGGELPARSEERWIGNRRGDRARTHDANTGHRRQRLADLALSMPLCQAQLDRPNPGHRVVQLVHERLSRKLREPLLFTSNFFRQQFDMPETLRCSDAELGHVGAQRIDQHGALPDQQVACTMQHQNRLLLRVLHRHEPHRRPTDSFTDSFSIGCIVLVALDVGFHIRRRHQPHRMSELGQLAGPVVSGGTGMAVVWPAAFRRMTCSHMRVP